METVNKIQLGRSHRPDASRRLSRVRVLFAALLGMGLMQTNAQAGVMLSWDGYAFLQGASQQLHWEQQDQAAPRNALGVGEVSNSPVGSTGAAAPESASENSEPESAPEPVADVTRFFVAADLANSSSGASAPVNGSSGAVSFGSPVALSSLVVVPPLNGEYCGWREHAPRCPRRPALELLDPPKVRA
jgi:hypothetical protein